jgi:hypothetical protein
MSIVSYHARVSASGLSKLRDDPDRFWVLPQQTGPDGAELLYLDKDWSALSYLLSAKSREEHKHDTALQAVQRCERKGEDLSDAAAWQAALQREARNLGFALVDTRALPDDPLLVAIEGRGPEQQRLPGIGYGALVFEPAEVSRLSAALDRVTDADLRKFFDTKTMEMLDVAGMRWTQEQPSVFAEILVPCFERLREFFQRAAEAQQHILVAHQ